jgi:type II secretion system protein J
MKPARSNARAGFTLIEILVSIGILSLVVAAIYSSWTAILRASKVGQDAAAAAQRSRVAMRKIEDSLTCAQLYGLNAQYYGFMAQNGSDAMLSFVARLPQSFPRSGRFGDFDMRRLTYTLEQGQDGRNELVLRQQPIVMDVDEDEKNFPLVLARDVKEFAMAFWDSRLNDWVEEWRQTNQLPKIMLLKLTFAHTDARGVQTVQELPPRVIALPSMGVPPGAQSAMGPGGMGPGGVMPGRPPGGMNLTPGGPGGGVNLIQPK